MNPKKPILLALSLVSALAVVAFARGGEPAPFELTFERGLDTRAGTAPQKQAGIAFVPGRDGGRAAIFRSGAVLAYPATTWNPKNGTVEMWISPTWDSVGEFGEKFFWAVENPDKAGDRVVLGFLGREGESAIYFGPDGGLGGVKTEVKWRAGEWHHVMASWDEAAETWALSIDGRSRHVARITKKMPQHPTAFHVGSLRCITRWNGPTPDDHMSGAALDDVRVHTAAVAPDFDVARRLVAADRAAFNAYRAAQQAKAPAYNAARTRLEKTSLDAVAHEHREVTWEEMEGLAAPLTLRVPLHARYHPDRILWMADGTIALGRESDSLGVGFALGGTPIRAPGVEAMTRTLDGGFRPIVQSAWNAGEIAIEQTALAYLPDDDETVTGRENQRVVVRWAVTNRAGAPRQVPLLLLVGNLGDRQNVNYSPYLGSLAAWMSPNLGIGAEGRALTRDGRVLLTYHAPVPGIFHAEFASGIPEAERLTNVLEFPLTLKPGETQRIDVVTAGSSRLQPAAERPAMEQVTFEAALARARKYWDHGLDPGMKLTTPEPRLNDAYRALILMSLGTSTQNPDKPWQEVNQSHCWNGVWPWEAAFMLNAMFSLGYQKELAPALRFSTERQGGIGKYEEPGRGPEGAVTTNHGIYTGNFILRWMSETGAVLWTMGAYYNYSRDRDWLVANRASILAACDWIEAQRATTRRYLPDGRKVAYFGLLPRGRVHDWDGWRHHFTFTDAFTWRGLTDIADAFTQAGLPEAAELQRQAEDYRQSLLAATDRAQFVDPETKLLFIPNTVLHREGDVGGIWWADGPMNLFSLGLLDARTDARFDPMVGYMKAKYGILLGMMGNMLGEQEAANGEWYVNSAERGFFTNYLARGETEKALLLLYSTLTYGMSQDCYQTVERILQDDQNFSPFQPNASGNGRILEMIRRMVIDEQDRGSLWLLRGCPRRWFEDGRRIEVSQAPTLYGPMNLRSQAGANRIEVEIDAPAWNTAPEIRLALRHPSRRPPTKVEVNGQRWTLVDHETVVLPKPQGRLHLLAWYD